MKLTKAEEIDIDSAFTLVKDDSFWAERKYDGVRVISEVEGFKIRFYSKNGIEFKDDSLADVEMWLRVFFQEDKWVFDGEFVAEDNKYYIFDVLESPMLEYGADIAERRAHLDQIKEVASSSAYPVHFTNKFTTQGSKIDLLKAVAEMGGEGVVFKNKDYVFKLKYKKEVDVFVGKQRGDKQSREMYLLDEDDNEYSVGGVKVTKTVKRGDVITVRYAKVSANKRLVQPVFVRKRTDKEPCDCTEDQLDQTNLVV